MEFRIDADLESPASFLDALALRHVPFAQVLALNRTTATVQREARRSLPDRFTIRSAWVGKGIRLAPATKRAPVARVYTLDWYMELQEEGGVKRPARSGQLWIPANAVRQGGVFAGKVLPSMRPRTLLHKARAAELKAALGKRGRKAKAPTAFVASLKGGKTGVFIRTGPGRLPLVRLYTLQGEAHVASRWHFRADAERLSVKGYRREFLKALQEALAGNREGGRPKPLSNLYVDLAVEHGEDFARSLAGRSVLDW